MGILPNIFSKREDETLAELKKQIDKVKKTPPSQKPAKKQKKVKREKTIKAKKPIVKEKELTNEKNKEIVLMPNLMTFYSKPIHISFFNGKWYASLKDILILGGDDQVLEKMKNDKEFQKKFPKFVFKKMTLLDDINQEIEYIDDKGFIWLLPILRENKLIFPGAFPSWLANVVNGPAPTSQG